MLRPKNLLGGRSWVIWPATSNFWDSFKKSVEISGRADTKLHPVWKPVICPGNDYVPHGPFVVWFDFDYTPERSTPLSVCVGSGTEAVAVFRKARHRN